MRRQQIQPYLLVLGIALALSSCFNEPNYSNTPEIEFKGISRYTIAAGKGVGQSKRDSIVITIGFKDGDGDLGNSLPPSKADSTLYASNGGWGNYQIKTFRYINKQYVELPLSVNTTLIFPDLAKDKPKGAIEGTLDFNQVYQYGTTYRLYPTKFQIRIRDRALQQSNVIETDTVTLPFQQ
ncbi:hypothetical protein [Spirosoma sp. KNUC1025]|uniref:hypothetical protein n=1 Tax=Spirosoma sp. KNUC1025 TaxID=2894082 RepID=UPI00386FCCC1|nr:hypothetical protein LN737_26215 [Spirosoma sp. KNUC1025]